MFRNFRQRNLIHFLNIISFKGHKFHMTTPKACLKKDSLNSLTGTVLDYTNYVKLIGTVTFCRPIVDGYLYTIAQIDSSFKNKIIYHNLNLSRNNHKDLGLSVLKNEQRVNLNGYIRSYSFSRSLRVNNVLAGCRISIIPKTIQLRDDEIDYTDRCIAMMQGIIRSDLMIDEVSCKFVLETKMAIRNDMGEIIEENRSTYHLIIIEEPELKKIFEETIKKYDEVILEGYIAYHNHPYLLSEVVGAIYAYKFLKIDRLALFTRALESKDDDDDRDFDDHHHYDTDTDTDTDDQDESNKNENSNK